MINVLLDLKYFLLLQVMHEYAIHEYEYAVFFKNWIQITILSPLPQF